jgi:hypothetical protein
MNDDTPGPCSGCEQEDTGGRPVSWSPAFTSWLCPDCLLIRTDAVLGETRRAELAARRDRDAS